MITILLSLGSALTWGAADFAGGLSSRKIGIFKTVFFQELIGLTLLIPALLALREPLPPRGAWMFAGLAGLFGNIGLLLLYQALATGKMSIAGPVSALMTAVLPVVIGSVTEGFPGVITFLGFGFALAAVWLVSQHEDRTRDILGHLADLRLPLLAGIGFGLFFILIHEATRTNTIWPMIVSRSVGLLTIGITLLLRREGWAIERAVTGVLIWNGTLDIAGNALYILAGQAGRLDIAAVISSLYPGATVVLAWMMLKERLSRLQWVGIGAALAALVLLTL